MKNPPPSRNTRFFAFISATTATALLSGAAAMAFVAAGDKLVTVGSPSSALVKPLHTASARGESFAWQRRRVRPPTTFASPDPLGGTVNGAVAFSNTPLLRDDGDSEPAISIHPNGT